VDDAATVEPTVPRRSILLGRTDRNARRVIWGPLVTAETSSVRPPDVDASLMTVVALLSVAPVIEDSMSGEVAKAVAALDEFDVSYETNPMGTVIEADEIGELFAAAQAAHEAVDADRVSTVLKIDDKRGRDHAAAEKVEAVEEHLGREARSDQ
jgi:uncharacterized protein (TIGR00106 family)